LTDGAQALADDLNQVDGPQRLLVRRLDDGIGRLCHERSGRQWFFGTLLILFFSSFGLFAVASGAAVSQCLRKVERELKYLGGKIALQVTVSALMKAAYGYNMRKLFLIPLTLMAATAAVAQETPVLVSDPAMCPLIAAGQDVQEMGMILDANGMYEIEFYCEFQPPIDIYWHEERTDTRVGYCAEPGFINPTVFAFQMSDYEPGLVRVWEQGGEGPTEFHACPIN